MGNPHCVAFIDDVDGFDLAKYGPAVERHPSFPERVNAHFVEVINRRHLKMRVWERGTGETLACGSGACAVCVAASLNGLAERKVSVRLPGGVLAIEWRASDHRVLKTGPAREVFEGEWTGRE
jgi:diaminopimelate epimerase